MNKYIYFILTGLIILLGSCNKPADKPAIDTTDTSKVHGNKYVDSRLLGKWIWVNTRNVGTGVVISPNTTGYSAKIEFYNDTIFNAYRNDSAKLHTHYHLMKAKSIYDNQLQYVVEVDSASVSVSYVFPGGDTLILRQECVDCFIEKYVKKAQGSSLK